MRQTRSAKTIGGFQKFPDNDNKTSLYLEDTLNFFVIQRKFGHFESIKQRGIRVTLHRYTDFHPYGSGSSLKRAGIRTALVTSLDRRLT